MSSNSTALLKRYFFEFGGSMLAYTGVLVGVVMTRPHEGMFRYIELLPTLPLLLGFWAIIRYYKRLDEYYQRIHSEAFALGALVLGLGVMIWGFAENAGLPELSTMFIAPALIGLWGLCIPIVTRRYK